jgi:ribonuclease BN (tRNA processing enzyme)
MQVQEVNKLDNQQAQSFGQTIPVLPLPVGCSRLTLSTGDSVAFGLVDELSAPLRRTSFPYRGGCRRHFKDADTLSAKLVGSDTNTSTTIQEASPHTTTHECNNTVETNAQKEKEEIQRLCAVYASPTIAPVKPAPDIPQEDEDEIDLSSSDEDEDGDETAVCAKEEQESSDKNHNNSNNNKKNSATTPSSFANMDPSAQANAEESIKKKLSDPQSPYMLVLGTGCAAPSAMKGSSGYAIFMPTTSSTGDVPTKHRTTSSHSLYALLDCGEGCLTSLIQQIPEENLSLSHCLQSLQLIWISHAHLDHYGGLPTIVNACYNERQQQQQDSNKGVGNSNCASTTSCDPILVVAPAKCLRYLNSALRTKDGVKNRGADSSSGNGDALQQHSRIFCGITHSDFDAVFSSRRNGAPCHRDKQEVIARCLEPSVSLLRNVPVEHCPNAYALILGLKVPPVVKNCNMTISGKVTNKSNHNDLFCLVYSGDCRPSNRLVSECRAINNEGSIDLLIHEATFDDTMISDAITKRHSTVSEALKVAQDISAAACLLTHFSQRYPHTSNINISTIGDPVFLIDDDEGTGKKLCSNPPTAGIIQQGPGNNEPSISRSRCSRPVICSAVDGLWFPLTSVFISSDAFQLLNSVMHAIFRKETNQKQHNVRH